MMTDILSLSIKELEELLKSKGEPAYRARQIFQWMYRGVTDFADMKNLPAALRAKLAEDCVVCSPEILAEQVSAKDGTRKYLFGLSDGNAVETVLMRYRYGWSVCVSSQAGCRMGCRFCASTVKGLARSLTAGEILAQVITINRLLAEEGSAEGGEPARISHIVVMGTGEPFDNYENLARFIELASAKEGLGLSRRNITVSTCGIVPMIERFGDEYPQVNLAISLHAATDEKRSALMPVNRKYPVAEVIEAAKNHASKTGKRVTFEYALTAGKNDTEADLKALTGLLKGMLCHVNLIPLNKVDGTGLETSGRKRAEEFRDLLEKAGIPATVRRELGSDIDAACGQLRLRKGEGV